MDEGREEALACSSKNPFHYMYFKAVDLVYLSLISNLTFELFSYRSRKLLDNLVFAFVREYKNSRQYPYDLLPRSRNDFATNS